MCSTQGTPGQSLWARSIRLSINRCVRISLFPFITRPPAIGKARIGQLPTAGLHPNRRTLQVTRYIETGSSACNRWFLPSTSEIQGISLYLAGGGQKQAIAGSTAGLDV